MTTNIDVGIHGLRSSLDTLLRTEDAAEGGAAVGTAAFWACALDEQLRAVDSEYELQRDADQDGRVLPGIRLVRNAVTHGAVVAVEPAKGIVFPVVFPVSFHSLIYRPRQDLLAAWVGDRHRSRETERQNDMYDRHLAHRRIALPLQAAERWFRRIAQHSLVLTIGSGHPP